MTNEQLIRLKELLQIVSNDSEVMFKTKSESKDFIISYLQGTIKGVVDIMEDNISLANQKQFIIFRYKENKDMTNETAKLEIIKNVLVTILESDVIVNDNKSDAFKFGYLKGTINTIIGYINEEMVTTTQHEIQEVEYIVRWRDMCSHTGSSPVLTTKSGGRNAGWCPSPIKWLFIRFESGPDYKLKH